MEGQISALVTIYPLLLCSSIVRTLCSYIAPNIFYFQIQWEERSVIYMSFKSNSKSFVFILHSDCSIQIISTKAIDWSLLLVYMITVRCLNPYISLIWCILCSMTFITLVIYFSDCELRKQHSEFEDPC